MLIFGASGHGSVIRDTLKSRNVLVLAFVDDNKKGHYLDAPIISPNEVKTEDHIIIGIGDNNIRKEIKNKLGTVKYGVAIHRTVIVGSNCYFGLGTVAFAGVIVNAESIIGNHVILNTNCSVDHHCVIEDFVHVSPGATICGGVKIKEGVHIGAGAVVLPNLTIGKGATIGAGAVVISDIPANKTVVGVPAK